MENALSQLSTLPATKAQQTDFFRKAKDELLSGNYNPLQVRVFFKSIIDTLQNLMDDKEIKEIIMDEADKYHEKTFEVFGSKITKSKRTTWDYKVCNDPVWNSLKEQIKIREAQLQSGLDASTGETLRKPDQKVSEFLQIEIQ